MVGDELLEVLRAATGIEVLGYAEAPTRLHGGFFTENHSFRLEGLGGQWGRPLVLRLFPSEMSSERVGVEVEAQRAVVAQGYPAAPVVLFDREARLAGRQFMVMERLPGDSMMSAFGPVALVRSGPRLLRELPRTTAAMQAALHSLDPAPLLDSVGRDACTVSRWFGFLEERVDSGAGGFAHGLRWLVENQPRGRSELAICHGDLWPGNLLVEGGAVTGVLDWTVATVAEPALDVGFTAMAFTLAPVDLPHSLAGAVSRVTDRLARSYVREYQRMAPADLRNQPYYEALRCACELATVAAFRLAVADGRTDEPRPTWSRVAPSMIEYFRVRTGVELTLPTDV